ncbi:MAG TPA: VOC family protein [Gemmatimonadaceae bacterium]|nr:VOC family protein [Gemmatimonadaceae bacterium]
MHRVRRHVGGPATARRDQPPPHERRRGGLAGALGEARLLSECPLEELSAQGVKFAAPPRTESWGTSAIFSDPDGNQFVISSR